MKIGDGAAGAPRRPEQVEMHGAGFFGDHAPRDKERHLASRFCVRKMADATSSVRQNLRDRGTNYFGSLSARISIL
jgi:hypothetical protein